MYIKVDFYKRHKTGQTFLESVRKNIYSNFFEGVTERRENINGAIVVLDDYGVPYSGQISSYSLNEGISCNLYSIKNGVWKLEV